MRNCAEKKTTKQKSMYVLRQFHDFKDHGLHMWLGSSFELRRIDHVSMKNVNHPAKNAL
jgi:hypothetical protein